MHSDRISNLTERGANLAHIVATRSYDVVKKLSPTSPTKSSPLKSPTSTRRVSYDLLKTCISDSIITIYQHVHKWAEKSTYGDSEIFTVPKDVDGLDLAMILNISLYNGTHGYEVVYVQKLHVVFIRKSGRLTIGIPGVKVVGKE